MGCSHRWLMIFLNHPILECYLLPCQGPPGEMGAQGSPGPPGAPVSNPEPP